jgi:membrane protein
VWHLGDFAISLCVVALLFAALFRYVPDTRVHWHDVWVGAIATAVLFDLGKFGIGFYLGHSGIASTFGAAGSVVVILAWVYYSSQIVFLGAEFTHVYAKHHGSRAIQGRQERRPAA